MRDRALHRWAALIRETFARQYFPNLDPIGQHFGKYDRGHRRERVAMISNVSTAGAIQALGRMLMTVAAIVAAAGEIVAVAGAHTPLMRVPQFKVDPFWPRPLPNHWIVGAVVGVDVDARDHVWIVHRPSTLQPNETRAIWRASPPVP